MKKSKWIWFDELPPPEDLKYKPKTKRFGVYANKDCKDLGTIKWNNGWRIYAFYPWGDTHFKDDCLMDIANFIKDQMRLRKENCEARDG